MKIVRLFSSENYKGTKNYIHTQKKYEIARTILYFALSGMIFLIGFLTTKTRLNLLTVVAVLGCLPACKSAVSMIMFLRFQSCSESASRKIEEHSGGLSCLYDLVFTSYEKNFCIAHLTVAGNTLCGYSEDEKLEEQAFCKHLEKHLKLDGFKNVTIKIFTDPEKYVERLEQLKERNTDEKLTSEIAETIRNIIL